MIVSIINQNVLEMDAKKNTWQDLVKLRSLQQGSKIQHLKFKTISIGCKFENKDWGNTPRPNLTIATIRSWVLVVGTSPVPGKWDISPSNETIKRKSSLPIWEIPVPALPLLSFRQTKPQIYRSTCDVFLVSANWVPEKKWTDVGCLLKIQWTSNSPWYASMSCKVVSCQHWCGFIDF